MLGKVSLLREVECDTPHRGHLDILNQLSWGKRQRWISRAGKPETFDSLLEAWLDELDTEALNRRFYKDLERWFEHAVKTISFPKRFEDKREDWTIRLITRLLFVWFIKEKGLVSEELFTPQICELLKDRGSDKDSYYSVILRNLFFVTLNTPIAERRPSQEDQQTPHDSSPYLDQDKVKPECKEELLDLFDKTPFINGGLFDGWDDFEGTKKSSNWNGKRVSVPDRLFWCKERGLLEVFRKYKFTVEESTPLEQDVALDPELLGQVFENLLSVYNPETRANARKQTGSFYTPRPIVDYMVRESLTNYLMAKTSEGKDEGDWETKVRSVLDYAKPLVPGMTAKDKEGLVRAISEIKIFDPACGSGAFPMGILNQLSLALSRLDPENEQWRRLQEDRAKKDAGKVFTEGDKKTRDACLKEINETFSLYSSEFGRKLFLIQNSIFGVDVQPIACQIAKLRFFISLMIEQKESEDKDENYGIHPLPNLETRFISADALIPFIEARQRSFGDDKVDSIIKHLKRNRERHFNAALREDKHDCITKDKELRGSLKEALLDAWGGNEDYAQKIADWNPYKQATQAEWFDAEYMFSIKDGFDIVIGNPPYVKSENLTGKTKDKLHSHFGWQDDLYLHFIFRGMESVTKGGVLSYITNDSFIGLKTKVRARNLLLENKISLLVKCPKETFRATIYAAVFIATKEPPEPSHQYQSGAIRFPGYQYHHFGPVSYAAVNSEPDHKLLFSSPMLDLYKKLTGQNEDVKEFLSVLDTGIDANNVRHKIFFPEKVKPKLSRMLQGRQIQAFYLNWDSPKAKYKFCDTAYKPLPVPGAGKDGKPSKYNEIWKFRGHESNHHQPERLLIRQTSDKIIAAYHNEKQDGQFYTDHTLFTVLPRTDKVDLKYAMSVLNSKLMKALYQFIAQGKGKTLAQVRVGSVRRLPFVAPSKAKQQPLIALAEKITAAKKADPEADTREWEDEIDKRVYALYGLTDEDIEIIDSAVTG